MESIRGFFSRIIELDRLRSRRLHFIAIALLSFGLGCVNITLFEARLAPLALAAALALRLSDRDPLPALLGALLGSLVLQSLSTFAFCCFAAPALLLPRESSSPLRRRFLITAGLLILPSIIMGKGSFIGTSSYLLAECILLLIALVLCLLMLNINLRGRTLFIRPTAAERKLNSASTAVAGEKAGEKTGAKDGAEAKAESKLELVSSKSRALSDVLFEVSAGCGDGMTGRQLHNIANRLLKLTADEPNKPKRFELSVGTALAPKRSNQVTGDSCTIRSTGHCVLAALSDGMGSGTAAEAESLRTLELMEKLIGVGFTLAEAADCVNMLMLDCPSGEMYATLDAALIDLSSGEMQLLKSGAAPSYLIRDGEIRTLYSEALPIGIVRDIAPAVSDIPIQRGDILIMMTDGICDALGMELIAALHECVLMLTDPEKAANALLDEARKHGGADDMSIILIRIESR